VPMPTGWAKASGAFTFIDGAEIGGLYIAEGIELGYSILIAIGVAVIESGHSSPPLWLAWLP